jgi:hypothetical protein
MTRIKTTFNGLPSPSITVNAIGASIERDIPDYVRIELGDHPCYTTVLIDLATTRTLIAALQLAEATITEQAITEDDRSARYPLPPGV